MKRDVVRGRFSGRAGARLAGASFLSGALGLVLFACGGGDSGKPALPTPDDFLGDIRNNQSCALNCDPACVEADKPWKCPALDDWSNIPHAPECGTFDGKTFPAVVPGKCNATDPAGEAIVKANIADALTILPDGRRLQAAGAEWVFNEPDTGGGFPASILLVPGTKWAIISDDGYKTHTLRVVDTVMLRAKSGNPVASLIKYPAPKALNYGLAWRDASKTLYASSGNPDSKIYAYDLDMTTGAATENVAKTIKLKDGAVPQGIGVSPDGKTLVVGQAKDSKLLVFSLEDATYGTQKGAIDVRTSDVFAVRFDPDDTTSNTAYATMWTSPSDPKDATKMRLLQIDVAGLAAKTIAVGKAPEEMAFLDARYLAVANNLGDSISIVDRVASSVVGEVSVGDHGEGPGALAYDRARKRLYATLGGSNGLVAFDVEIPASGPPTLTPAGTLPTGWWPTGVAVDDVDGAIYVTNGKGHGAGTDQKAPVSFSDGYMSDHMRGSVQGIEFPDGQTLTTAAAAWKAQNEVGALPGYSTVQCNGAPYDFPIPQKIEDGPSQKIKHVYFIVRENKTFDDIMGDMPGVDGQPAFVMAPGHMDDIWGNARAIAAQFAHMDNYYNDAEQSIQGHEWTVFGRSTDYDERRWTVIWGRGEFGVTDVAGLGETTTPAEGTLFTSLMSQGVSLDNDGELTGGLAVRDTQWPGGSTDSTTPDTVGACYIAARARVTCNPKDFTYAWLSNDHTFGLAEGKPNPALMISTNDEGTGMLLDGISHSPFWQDSLVIVIEDDPNTGGDHVDQHRTIALLASPWIKRKYVSHAHYDVASLHKLISHVYGKPYRNVQIARAGLPLDLFTSTPDYTPYEYKPRAYKDLSCNPGGTTGAQAASAWDFTEPDDQPGLDQQVFETVRGLPKVIPTQRAGAPTR